METYIDAGRVDVSKGNNGLNVNSSHNFGSRATNRVIDTGT